MNNELINFHHEMFGDIREAKRSWFTLMRRTSKRLC